METVLVGCGSNLGDRERTLREALAQIAATPGLSLLRVSGLYETEPVGGPPQGRYLNACIVLQAASGSREILGALLDVERLHGRVRSVPNAPRTLDLDLLLHGSRVVSEAGLAVPHPRMLERAFVLVPAAEVAPDLVHPVAGRPLGDLAACLPRTGGLRLHRTSQDWAGDAVRSRRTET